MLNDKEQACLDRNGFVLADRLYFDRFLRGYGWIYWKDLPVLVTTDSILHSIHRTYDMMLQEVEGAILKPNLIEILKKAQAYLEANRLPDEALQPLYDDLDWYLRTAIYFVERYPTIAGLEEKLPWMPDYVFEHYARVILANRIKGIQILIMRNGELVDEKTPDIKVDVFPVDFCGVSRQVDFRYFKARGHYDGDLLDFFCTMTWLQLLDFRLVEYLPDATPVLHVNQLAAAHLLMDAIEQSGARPLWDEFNNILQAFIGWSDNVTLNGLRQFAKDMNVQSAADYFKYDPAVLLAQLVSEDYGFQQIRGQVQYRYENVPDVPAHIVFLLMGQRYTVESHIMQGLLDKQIAFEMRDIFNMIQPHSDSFWHNSFYNIWLKAILTLQTDTTDACYPEAMRSPAWAAKMLHTQLAGWTQLRHDNILHLKPPYPILAVCDYPSGFVEPYPAFYATFKQYAQFGRETFSKLESSELQQTLLTYFDNLEKIMTRLEALSHKELAHEGFDEHDITFLRSVVVRKSIGDMLYGNGWEEDWDGWYIDLLPFEDKSPFLIADMYYDANKGQVFHCATGDPILMVMRVNDVDYYGVAYTYYELMDANILNDYDWHKKTYGKGYPPAPDWTRPFRVSTPEREMLSLPTPR